MELNKPQALELERIREWACCLEPERRFMAEVEVTQLKLKNEALRKYVAHKDDCFQARSVFRVIHCSCGLDALLAGKEPT